MNLQDIAAGYVGAVNPLNPVSVAPNMGYVTLTDGSRVPSYGAPVVGLTAQIQSLTYTDLRQIDGLNIIGVRRAIYLNGRWPGVVRPFQRGGDLITFPSGAVYLVAMLLEDWDDTAGWCKVVATLQNVPPARPTPVPMPPGMMTLLPESEAEVTFIELNTLRGYALANGLTYGQRVLIVDNLLLASPDNPLTITGLFNSGSPFIFNLPGQAIEPFWDGTVWVLA